MAIAVQQLSQEEALVQQYGFDYEIGDIPLSKIDPNSSSYNHRLLRIDEDRALTYGVAMENGDRFPPVIVHLEDNLLVPDAGVHRLYARFNFTGFKTIYGITLKNLDLTDPATLLKLERLRIKSNDGHGLGYDMTERKWWACLWLIAENDNLEDTAAFFNLEPKVLASALQEHRLDEKVTSFKLKPENFTGAMMKKAVTRTGLLDFERKEIERIVVAFSGKDVRHKVTGTQINDLVNELLNSTSVTSKTAVLDEFRSSLNALQGRRMKRKSQLTIPPTKMFNAATGLIRDTDVKAFIAAVTSREACEEKQDQIRTMVLKLASIDRGLARVFKTDPSVDVTSNR